MYFGSNTNDIILSATNAYFDLIFILSPESQHESWSLYPVNEFCRVHMWWGWITLWTLMFMRNFHTWVREDASFCISVVKPMFGRTLKFLRG